MDKRQRHPNKEIEKAVVYAESYGWRFKKSGNSAHAWGKLLCVKDDREGCKMSIWSTPKNPEAHAKQIERKVRQCPHSSNEDT